MRRRAVAAALPAAAVLALARPAGAAQPAKPPPALVDQVMADTNLKTQVSLALDNGYGVGLNSWDGRLTDIRRQVTGRQIDLNGDRTPEWLVLVQSHITCSETQIDCRLLVYTPEGGGFRRVWAAYRLGTGPVIGGRQLGEVTAGPGRTNGWLDLSWRSMAPSTRGQTIALKFDGREYR
ncbi:MAG: hypothetical protein IT176_07240 [Acidobacteria bacterium]|nr:hypothetical protein [Acidobacteriota bacterium]